MRPVADAVSVGGRRLTPLLVDTGSGPAKVHLHAVGDPVGAVVLGHGAGGGVAARDLVAAADAAGSLRFASALVEQPYRVAGRRAPARAQQLDAAWRAVVSRLRERELSGLPLVLGGRPAGARVACRTAEDCGAVAVLCLAFPLRPPRRTGSGPAPPAPDRLPELDLVRVPMLVVQGSSDPFGMPPPSPTREVVSVRGNHSLSGDLDGLRVAVSDWLARVVSSGSRASLRSA